jgi:PKD repeat protein
MKTLRALALVLLVLGCHIDKLLNGGGGKTPPSEAPPARVAFSSSLSSARAGEPISPPVQVTVQDSAGRVTLRDTLVTLSLGANPSGDSLRGTKQVRSVNGVATFANVRLDKAASGYTLTAAAPELHPDTSGAFSVMPAPATELAFTAQPSAAMQDSAIKPPVKITAYDSLGNVATNFTGAITLALGANPGGGTLSGGAPVNAVNGVATFPNLSVDQPGNGYTLRATASGLTAATSSAFNVTALPNQPPVAAFSSSCTQLTCSFTSTSNDPDGSITGYAWTFGDGTTATTQNPSHTYTAGGTFTVTLTVTDNQSATNNVSHTVTVTAPPPVNQPPVAAFSSSCTQLACSFTSTSSDPDGTIASYAWTFGDGTTATTQNPSHTYAAGGTFTVTLTVTDNQGATGNVSHTVTVTAPPPPNQPPVAAFSSSCTQLTCSFTSTSNDPDGSITGYAWTFGDGVTSTAQNPSHTYTAGGTFTVTLTVTDNQSATGNVAHTVTVTAPPPPNQPPSVSAGSDQTVLVGAMFTLSGGAFSDPDHDGPWTVTIDWGDGTSSTSTSPGEGSIGGSHSYPVTLLPHDYQLTVTVVDAHGGRGSATKTVHVVLS